MDKRRKRKTSNFVADALVLNDRAVVLSSTSQDVGRRNRHHGVLHRAAGLHLGMLRRRCKTAQVGHFDSAWKVDVRMHDYNTFRRRRHSPSGRDLKRLLQRRVNQLLGRRCVALEGPPKTAKDLLEGPGCPLEEDQGATARSGAEKPQEGLAGLEDENHTR